MTEVRRLLTRRETRKYREKVKRNVKRASGVCSSWGLQKCAVRLHHLRFPVERTGKAMPTRMFERFMNKLHREDR